GSHWHAHGSFENVVIFGDSYSKYFEGRTWVDYMQQKVHLQGSPLIHNFAMPGAFAKPEDWTPDHLLAQMSRFFQGLSKEKAVDKIQMDPSKTTYCATQFILPPPLLTSHANSVEAVSDALHSLYVKAGARNFVLLDVPPIDRSPQAVNTSSVEDMRNCVEIWNSLLQTHATQFGITYKEATVLVFSSHQVLTGVLDVPSKYGFSDHEPTTECGGIWMDDLHLTSEVHEILGEQLLVSVLGSQIT
ncbi:carbohydrate esterase family 16 protein, partial [Coniophora puteana RWD-64-598 SS2]